MNDRISELKQEYFKVSQAKRLMLLCLALAVFLGVIWSLNIGPSKVKPMGSSHGKSSSVHYALYGA